MKTPCQVSSILWVLLLLAIFFPSSSALSARVTLNSSLSFAERYTDNLFRTSTNKKKDISSLISPFASLKYDQKDFILQGRYNGTAQFFVKNPKADRFQHSIRLFGTLRRFKLLNISFSEGFIFTPATDTFLPGQRQQITSGGVGGLGGIGGVGGIGGIGLGNQGIITPRTNTIRNQANLNMNYQWTRLLSTRMSTSNFITRFSSNTLQSSVFQTTSIGGAFKWLQTSQTTSALNYDRIFLISDVATMINIQNFTLSFRHGLRPRVFLTGRVGASLVRNNRTRLIATLSTLVPYPSGNFTLLYTQRVGLAQGLAATPTLTQLLATSASRQFTQRFRGAIRFFVGRNVSLKGNSLDLITFQPSARIQFQILRWLNLNLLYRYAKQINFGSFGGEIQTNKIEFGLTTVYRADLESLFSLPTTPTEEQP